jgi:hypothetical protein
MEDAVYLDVIVLLGVLSNNNGKQSQINTVVPAQIKMDRVGFEPTTSAMPMPYPTGLDDRPSVQQSKFDKDINTFKQKNSIIIAPSF